MKGAGNLPPFDPETGGLNIIIETLRGSRNQYYYDERAGRIGLKKLLPIGMVFPFDFGFIPSTRSGDGDPLDVLVITAEPLFPGCLVRGRLLGAIKGQQHHNGKWESNDRIIAVPLLEERTPGERSFKDREGKLLREIETFFIFSHELEKQKFRVTARVNAVQARRLVETCAKIFEEPR